MSPNILISTLGMATDEENKNDQPLQKAMKRESHNVVQRVSDSYTSSNDKYIGYMGD